MLKLKPFLAAIGCVFALLLTGCATEQLSFDRTATLCDATKHPSGAWGGKYHVFRPAPGEPAKIGLGIRAPKSGETVGVYPTRRGALKACSAANGG